MERGLVSVDDLLDTLTVIAREADKALGSWEDESRWRYRVQRMKWEALEAIERAEHGDVSAGSNNK